MSYFFPQKKFLKVLQNFDELMLLTVLDLKQYCRDFEITGYSKKKKEAIVKIILNHQNVPVKNIGTPVAVMFNGQARIKLSQEQSYHRYLLSRCLR